MSDCGVELTDCSWVQCDMGTGSVFSSLRSRDDCGFCPVQHVTLDNIRMSLRTRRQKTQVQGIDAKIKTSPCYLLPDEGRQEGTMRGEAGF